MVKKDNLKAVKRVMQRDSFRKLTPFGIAGNEGNLDVSRILLSFFNKHREVFKEIFKENYQQRDESAEDKRFHIRVMNNHRGKWTCEQKAFGSIFYWAAYFGSRDFTSNENDVSK